ncbi:hypothetical protein [Plebeiibacterium marinum]|uniref:Uncharacterized protein n=1 Tax=Plebeiibacterium marinum TaxID=2992111 RepID=A0AAE3SL04_9BACT|nr:hypothetical protein [Plebeiobacterium marinum]MCW3807187.1 hypothetical protein [Plebeiobacterium marinum]
MGNTISYKSKNEEINGTIASILQTAKNHDFSSDIYLTKLLSKTTKG